MYIGLSSAPIAFASLSRKWALSSAALGSILSNLRRSRLRQPRAMAVAAFVAASSVFQARRTPSAPSWFCFLSASRRALKSSLLSLLSSPSSASPISASRLIGSSVVPLLAAPSPFQSGARGKGSERRLPPPFGPAREELVGTSDVRRSPPLPDGSSIEVRPDRTPSSAPSSCTMGELPKVARRDRRDAGAA